MAYRRRSSRSGSRRRSSYRSAAPRRSYRSRSRRRVSARSRPQTVRIVVQTAAASPNALGQSSIVPIRAQF